MWTPLLRSSPSASLASCKSKANCKAADTCDHFRSSVHPTHRWSFVFLLPPPHRVANRTLDRNALKSSTNTRRFRHGAGDNSPEWPQPRDAQGNAIRRAPLLVLMRVFSPRPHRRPFVADVTPRRAHARGAHGGTSPRLSFVWLFPNGTVASCFVVICCLALCFHPLKPAAAAASQISTRAIASRDASNASVSPQLLHHHSHPPISPLQ